MTQGTFTWAALWCTATSGLPTSGSTGLDR